MDPRPYLLTTLALLTAAPALAQETPQAVTPLDAVTTTATRARAVAGDTATPVTVINREEIERRDARSVVELIREIPGVESSGVPRSTAMKPVIRGLGEDRIVLRLDGARNNFNAGHRGRTFIDPELLRSVEVLRGPGSTLYGSCALGGVIAMTPPMRAVSSPPVRASAA